MLATSELDLAGDGATATRALPRGMLWRSVLSTRFDASRSIRRLSPLIEAGSSDTSMSDTRAAASVRRAASDLAGDRGQIDPLPRSIPRCPWARASSASISCSCCSLSSSTCRQVVLNVSTVALGSLRIISSIARTVGQRCAELVRGVGDEPSLGVERAFEALE